MADKRDWMNKNWEGMAKYLGFDSECEMLEALYEKHGTILGVANELGYTPPCVATHLRACKIRIRSWRQSMEWRKHNGPDRSKPV